MLALNRLFALGVLAVVAVLVPLASAEADPSYGFSISASSTDFRVNTGPARPGIYELYLWMDYSNPPVEKTGIASFEAEIRVSGDLLLVAFSPEVGWMNAVGGTHLLMAVQGCPSGPMLAGRLIVRGVESGAGSICLGRSIRSGVLGAADCERNPQLWEVRVEGFATEGFHPCCVNCRDRGRENLEVVSFTAPGKAFRGDRIEGVELVVRNSGPEDISQTIWIGLFLSADPKIGVLDGKLPGGRVALDGLASGAQERVVFPELAVPPEQTLAVGYLGVLVDDLDELPEGMEEDNVAALPMTILSEAARASSSGPGGDGLSRIRVAHATALPGEPVRIPLAVQGTGPLRSFDLEVSCPSPLETLGFERSPATEAWAEFAHEELKAGVARVVGSGEKGLALSETDWSTLGYLVVRAPREPGEGARLAVADAAANDQGLESIAGHFEVLEPFPSEFDLVETRRHPATGSFTIEYRIPDGISQEIEIGLYDFHGQLAMNLLRARRGPGRHGLSWEGADRAGRPMEPGIYFVRMIGPSFHKTRKLILD